MALGIGGEATRQSGGGIVHCDGRPRYGCAGRIQHSPGDGSSSLCAKNLRSRTKHQNGENLKHESPFLSYEPTVIPSRKDRSNECTAPIGKRLADQRCSRRKLQKRKIQGQ